MAIRNRIRVSALFLSICCALPLVQCNHGNCEDLRNELTTLKDKWQVCTRDLDCIKIGGNTKDCSGVLSCNLGVNRIYRSEADRRIASLPEDSVDCMVCTSPNCIEGDITLCEPVSGKCIIVTALLDAGTVAANIVSPQPGSTGGMPGAAGTAASGAGTGGTAGGGG
jgi:hypothetical protein